MYLCTKHLQIIIWKHFQGVEIQFWDNFFEKTILTPTAEQKTYKAKQEVWQYIFNDCHPKHFLKAANFKISIGCFHYEDHPCTLWLLYSIFSTEINFTEYFITFFGLYAQISCALFHSTSTEFFFVILQLLCTNWVRLVSLV